MASQGPLAFLRTLLPMKINSVLSGYSFFCILIATFVFPIRSFALQVSDLSGSSDLGSMLAAVYFRRGLVFTVTLGVVVTAALYGDCGDLPFYAVDTLIRHDTLTLLLSFYLVFLMNGVLNGSGAMGDVVSALEHVVGDRRVILAAVPALIGLVPSPSGAVLSAPFVTVFH